MHQDTEGKKIHYYCNQKKSETLRSCRGDRSAICRRYQKCRKIFQLQILGWQAVQYLEFQVSVLCRQENDRAESVLLKCRSYLAESSM